MPFKTQIALLSTSVINVPNSKVERGLIETNMPVNNKTADISNSFIIKQLDLNVVHKRLRADTDAPERNQNIERVDILKYSNVLLAIRDKLELIGISLSLEFF